jgi:hypothetical protein
MIELRERSESLIEDATRQGFTRKQGVEIAMYGVDKIINYGNLDRIEESYWYDVMDYLESIQLSK